MKTNSKVKIFFIVGLPRSGTTLLEQMLDQHSEISVCPEIASGLALWRLNAFHSIRDKSMHLILVNYLFDRSSFFKTKMTDVLIRQANRSFHFPINTEDWFNFIILDFVAEKNATLYGEKTPENLFYIKELQIAFPDSKFILLERNPYDVLYSIYENAKNMQGLMHSAEHILKVSRALIKRYLNAIIQFKRNNETQFMSIKYEELISMPVDILKQICLFLDVEFESQMMNYRNKKEFTEKGKNMKLIHTMLNEPIDTKKINKSFSHWEPNDIQFLNEYWKDEMNILGYTSPPLTAGTAHLFKLKVYLAIVQYYLKTDLVEGRWNKLRFRAQHFLLQNIRFKFIAEKLRRTFFLK